MDQPQPELPSPTWYELALEVASDRVDEAVALLDLAGFSGAELRERGATTAVVVFVHASSVEDATRAARRAGDALPFPCETARPVAVDAALWTDNWKEHFRRRTFAGRIEVVPPWEEPSPESPDFVSLVINPGMAFGTGLHETTAGCLELLARQVRPGMRVADIGCGSGILAIAALRLGAASALATDVDPLAVAAAEENSAANRVADRIAIELEDGEDASFDHWANDGRPGFERARDGARPRPQPHGNAKGFRARGAGAFDLVVANILAETLVDMRDDLVRAVTDEGVLLLSGIEVGRLKIVEDAFIRDGWHEADEVAKGEWVSLCLRRTAGLASTT